MSGYTLRNGHIVTAGKDTSTAVGVSEDRLCAFYGGVSIDLGGASIVYPSLINTHDHLQGNYTPQVGPKEGTYYLTWLPWDKDLKASRMFSERSHLLREDLYALSGYKCLFSGVSTVNDHFPHKLNGLILPTLPIRAIQEYGLAHEASSYDLKWGDGVEIEHEKAVRNGWPFITHLSEGFDGESMHGVEALEKFGVFDNHCLLIHCIAFSDEDIEKTAKAGASIAWCGASNMLMFNVTCKIRKMLQAGVNVTIGTDSAASGSCNFLTEIKYDRELYRRLYGEDLPAKTIFQMITINAAKAFWLDKKTGSIEEGKLADLLVLREKKSDPYENLMEANMEDIELLTLAGRPLYGELRFLDIFGGVMPHGYTQISVGGRTMFVIGDPTGLYLTIRKKTGVKKVLDFLPFEPEV